MDTAEKLHHLLDHWIEHNDQHAQTWKEWAEKASSDGLGAAAGLLVEAVRAVGAANDALRRAAETLGAAGHRD